MYTLWRCLLQLVPLLSFGFLVNATQIQFHDQSTKFGVALTSTFLDNGTQVLMQITAPASYGWAALGTGTMMKDSTMFVIYPSTDTRNVTLSIRTTTQHDMPKQVAANTVNARITSSSIIDGTMITNLVWQEFGQTRNGVDPRNEQQPFIWAVGPSTPIASNDVNLAISQHSKYGVIFADMPQSQVPSSQINAPNIDGTANINITPQPPYYRRMVLIHASLLAGAFVIIFPLGVIAKNINFRNTGFKIHWPVQCFAIVCVAAGLATAVSMSILGVQYKKFNEPHQIVGLSVCALVGLQAYFGWAHHVRYVMRNKRTFFSYAHMGLGRVVVYGGTTNAVLGFVLCGRGLAVIATTVIGGLLLVLSEFLSIRSLWRRRKEDALARRMKGYTSGRTYQKLKDVAVSESEVYSEDVRMRSFAGSDYINVPAAHH